MNTFDRLIGSNPISRRRVTWGAFMGLLVGTPMEQAPATSVSATFSGGATAEDYLAVQELVHRYATALDTLDGELWQSCFLPNTWTAKQVEQNVAYHRTFAHTMHNITGHSHRIRGRAATGVTYCIASMVKHNGEGLTKLDAYVRYRDEVVKEQDRWLFAKRDMDFLFTTEESPVKPGAPFLPFPVKPGSMRD